MPERSQLAAFGKNKGKTYKCSTNKQEKVSKVKNNASKFFSEGFNLYKIYYKAPTKTVIGVTQSSGHKKSHSGLSS